jgi:transcriptional regulator with PAS, ATPase and Fis domain
VGELFGGLAKDVKSLRSISELVDALDAARDEEALGRALEAWAKEYAGATSARVTGDFAPLAAGEANVVRTPRGPSACEVAVPAHGAAPHAIVFGLPVAHGAVADDLLRLLAVAGRVTGSALSRLASQRALEEDVASLRAMALGSSRAFLGESPAAAEVTRLVKRLATSDSTALVLGESGTGKSFVARLVHEASARASEPFRVINCAAIPESLVESELFGHEKGAFTGAHAAHVGAFESAGRGTILLDEIGELPLANQAKLLRVLEERTFERVGGGRPLRLAARVLAATNRTLDEMVADRKFREDLYYRVSVVTVRVPPLRARGDDVVLLARQMLADLAQTAGRRVSGFAPDALATLRAHHWPGNVRELRNAIEHALVLGSAPSIEAADLPETVRGGGRPPEGLSQVRLPARLDWLEKQAIEAALKATGGKRGKAAEILGIDRATLYKKLK